MTVGIIAKMVMVMFCLFSGMTAITFFIFGTTQYVFPWPDIAQVEYPAEQENGVKVPALPAL